MVTATHTRSRADVPVLYLDIDSTVRKGYDEVGHFINRPEDVEVFPQAVTMMRRWKDAGGRIVGASNQGGIALGIVDADTVNATMDETDRQTGGLFDTLRWCRHHRNAEDPAMARCWCRKPSPGLVIEAALALAAQHPTEQYPPHLGLFVGDRPEDQECAQLAGLDFEWAHEWRGRA